MKNCSNCYFKIGNIPRPQLRNITNNFCHFEKLKPINDICQCHSYGCEKCNNGDGFTDVATFMYNGKRYCEDCLSEIVGIEKRKYTSYQYYDAHGNFIGNSDDVDLEDILREYSRCEYIGED